MADSLDQRLMESSLQTTKLVVHRKNGRQLSADSGAAGMVAFQNIYEKYLSIDETAGGVLQLRADSDTVGLIERFCVKIQEKYKKGASEEAKKKSLKEGNQEVLINIDEAGTK